jgi:hypothetical protein
VLKKKFSRKQNHKRGVGISVNRMAEESIRLQVKILASEQREAAARARADATEQRAEAAKQGAQVLEGHVSIVIETNAQLQQEQQAQRDELSSLRQTQSGEVSRLVREQLDQQMGDFIAYILVLCSLHQTHNMWNYIADLCGHHHVAL